MVEVDFSWAVDERERDEWISRVRKIEGTRLGRVRYLDLDYRRDEFAHGSVGSRVIVDRREWAQPNWDFPGGHTVDFGIELVAESDRVWSVGWIPPGRMEGLAVYEGAMVPVAISAEASVAVWDVTEHTPWNALLGRPIESVQVEYERRGDSGSWWCSQIALGFAEASVQLLLAQGTPSGEVASSADNLVVRWASP
jgi:hypothetical protein